MIVFLLGIVVGMIVGATTVGILCQEEVSHGNERN